MKFHYKDKVKVLSGFYMGQIGFIESHHEGLLKEDYCLTCGQRNKDEYYVKIGSLTDYISTRFADDNLELVK